MRCVMKGAGTRTAIATNANCAHTHARPLCKSHAQPRALSPFLDDNHLTTTSAIHDRMEALLRHTLQPCVRGASPAPVTGRVAQPVRRPVTANFVPISKTQHLWSPELELHHS